MVNKLPGKRRVVVQLPEALYLKLKGVCTMNQIRLSDLVANSIRKYLHGNPLVTHWPPEYHVDFREKRTPDGSDVNPHASTREEPHFKETHEVGGTEGQRPPLARMEKPNKKGPVEG